MFTTKAIVIKYIKYSETSIIARIYTELFGLQSYIIKGVRKKNSRINTALFQPLMQLEMVVYHREKKELQNIKEVKPFVVYQSLYSKPDKSSIVLFIVELINKTIKEECCNSVLFDFISKSLIQLDNTSGSCSCFPHHFSIELTKYLGFYPNDNYNEPNNIFNLKEGKFQSIIDEIDYCIAFPLSEQLHLLLSNPTYIVPQNYSNPLLEIILLYYKYHLPNIKDFSSPLILHKVLH